MSTTIFEFERYVPDSVENVFVNSLSFLEHSRLISCLPINCSIVRVFVPKNNRI